MIYGKTGMRLTNSPPLNALPMNPKSSPVRRGVGAIVSVSPLGTTCRGESVMRFFGDCRVSRVEWT